MPQPHPLVTTPVTHIATLDLRLPGWHYGYLPPFATDLPFTVRDTARYGRFAGLPRSSWMRFVRHHPTVPVTYGSHGSPWVNRLDGNCGRHGAISRLRCRCLRGGWRGPFTATRCLCQYGYAFCLPVHRLRCYRVWVGYPGRTFTYLAHALPYHRPFPTQLRLQTTFTRSHWITDALLTHSLPRQLRVHVLTADYLAGLFLPPHQVYHATRYCGRYTRVRDQERTPPHDAALLTTVGLRLPGQD